MELTVIISDLIVKSATAGVSVTALQPAMEQGVGGVFLAALLVYLLAYLDLTGAVAREVGGLRRLLVSCILPLLIVFGGIVVFQALRLL